MGIVNVTPDSFSGGGRLTDARAAIRHAFKLREAGADILDVGGESTRPGAAAVPVDEEIRRVLPVIDALAGRGCVVSIDTMKPEDARSTRCRCGNGERRAASTTRVRCRRRS